MQKRIVNAMIVETRGNKPRPVYQFDKYKRLIKRYLNVDEAAESLGWKSSRINNAITNQRLCDNKWYFSRKEELEDLSTALNPQSARRIIRFFKLGKED